MINNFSVINIYKSRNLGSKVSSQMLYGANEIELGKQWASNKLLTNLSQQKEFLGCLRRDNFITVLIKQKSNTVPGDFLGRLVLGIEGDQVKVFGATIF